MPFFKEYRNIAILLVFGLVVLTVLSCLPYAPQGPFDARDYTRLAGMRLEQHPWTAAIEPLSAPMQVLAGAPDFRVAAACLLLWVFLGAGAWRIITEVRSTGKKITAAVWGRGGLTALTAVGVIVLMVGFFVIARVPGWRLAVQDPDLIVSDLHSHTVESFDGLVSTRTNLEWHASCGYGLVGLTDHDFLFAHDSEISSGPGLPAFVSGVECHTGPRVMVVAVCRDSHVALDVPQIGETRDRTGWFAQQVHEKCGGAVFVVTLNRLTPGDVAHVADSGVDGFEIVNLGHPDLRPDLRNALLDAAKSKGLLLVASTDWHGWGGFTRTWTVVRVPGAAALPKERLAEAAIGKLRERNGSDVIPVVAGYFGSPSIARAIFTPFVETVRYAMELSPLRVISWWIWVSAVFVLWVFLAGIGIDPGKLLLGILVGAFGLGLIVAGTSLAGEGAGHAAPYSHQVSLVAILIGAAVFLTFLATAVFSWRKGGLTRQPLAHSRKKHPSIAGS